MAPQSTKGEKYRELLGHRLNRKKRGAGMSGLDNFRSFPEISVYFVLYCLCCLFDTLCFYWLERQNVYLLRNGYNFTNKFKSFVHSNQYHSFGYIRIYTHSWINFGFSKSLIQKDLILDMAASILGYLLANLLWAITESQQYPLKNVHLKLR